MRIISAGTLREAKKYTPTCSKCGTQFEFERREAVESSDRGGQVLLVSCPICKARMGVKP